MGDIFTQDIKDLLKLATTDFDKFYKETEKKASGNYSTAASSGYSSTAASSGDSSKAASSGNSSTAASSGDSSTAASSGNSSTAASSGYSSKAASSGNYSKAASSGNSSTAASSGDSSKAASSGNSSTAASSGDSSTAASSGYSSKAASSGNYSTAASSGYSSKAASSGNSSTAASSGDSSKAASSGNYSTAASSGNYSTAASSGNYSTAASSGYSSKAASSGKNSACSALGYRAAVKGDLGNLLMASEYNEKNGKFIPIGGKADIVDGKKIKPNCWYIVENAKWVEVDFSDGIFLRVISTKGNIKKCKDDNERILYVVTDGTNNAHGDTIKEAQEALLFKTANRDVSAYKNMAMDTVKSPIEWAAVYSAITGACEAGCRHFMDQRKLKDAYTLSEILEETKGAYNYSRFIEVVGETND